MSHWRSVLLESVRTDYADGKRIAMRAGGTLKYIVQDNLGSTAMTTNGTVPESRARYNPFGELCRYADTIPTDKRFTGQQREYETGYNAIYDGACPEPSRRGARMYDAKIGRMLQPDTFYDPYNPQSLNRYSYVLNNPTTYTDPTGNCIPEITCPAGANWRVRKNEGWKRVILWDELFESSRDTGKRTNLPVWLGPVAAAEAIDPLPLEVVVGGITACVLFCDDAGHALRNVWEDVMTDTVVLSEGSPRTDNNGNPLPEGAKKLKGGQGYARQMGHCTSHSVRVKPATPAKWAISGTEQVTTGTLKSTGADG